MNSGDVVGAVLPIVLVVMGVALVWFLVELALTVRKTRATIDETAKKIDPVIENARELTESIKPAVAKIDPLVERVSLTVDAANLELMRVDQILEDVGDVADTASNTVKAVDTVVNAPLNAVVSVTDKVRSAFETKKASDASIELGAKKEAFLEAAREKAEAVLGDRSGAEDGGSAHRDADLEGGVSGHRSDEKYFTYDQKSEDGASGAQ